MLFLPWGVSSIVHIQDGYYQDNVKIIIICILRMIIFLKVYTQKTANAQMLINQFFWGMMRPVLVRMVGGEIQIKNIIYSDFQLIELLYKMAGGAQAREEKKKTIERLYELFGAYKQIILANFTNVGSSQIQQIRKILRPYKSILVISKNTLMKKVIRMRTEGIEQSEFKHLEEQFGGKIPGLQVLEPLLKGKVALIFSDASVYELKGKIEANKIPTEARVGALSPIDFTCPAGPTGLDPSQINFFHALNISTKIVKGQIQITKDFRVCTIGKQVKASEAALLKKLNMKPFEYGIKINSVYDDGAILPEAVISINPASLLERFSVGARNMAALSLAAGIPIEATIPLILANAFRNLAALSIESGYKIKELENLAAKVEPVKVEAPKKEEPKKEAPKKQAPKKEQPKVEEQEDIGMGDMFG